MNVPTRFVAALLREKNEMTAQRGAWVGMNSGEDARGSRPDDDAARAVIERYGGIRTSSGHYKFPDDSDAADETGTHLRVARSEVRRREGNPSVVRRVDLPRTPPRRIQTDKTVGRFGQPVPKRCHGAAQGNSALLLVSPQAATPIGSRL